MRPVSMLKGGLEGGGSAGGAGGRVVPINAAVAVTAIPDAEGPEARLFRAIQRAVGEWSGQDVPTPRRREAIRAALHQAVDTYLTGKLAERAGR